MMFKGNDLVRVVKQPPGGGAPYLIGEVAYVEEMQMHENEAYAYIHTLTLDGCCGGCGSVPVGCLVAENGPEWVLAFQRARASFEATMAKMKAVQAEWTALVGKVAAEHGVTVDAVEAIYAELHTWRNNRS